jgi:excinuclease ABC subunit A
MEPAVIAIRGAREHNLRNVSLTLPRGKLICFTGVSGSGKSSLAFDTLFAEGQRRYLESLSSYARQFLGQLARPEVDHISGLSPSICIQQKTSGWNPRSTVGTITQIHDYLRVFFARVGRQHCTRCNRPIQAQSHEQIVARILEFPEGTPILVLAPVVRAQKGEYRDLFEEMIRKGYAHARVDGEIVSLADPPALTRHVRHNIEIVADRLVVAPTIRARLSEAVENGLKLGSGTIIVSRTRSNLPTSESSGTAQSRKRGLAERKDLLLSSHYACPECDLSFEPPSPQLFSFNSPTGMCLTCDGMGTTFDFDPDLLVPDPGKSFLQHAVAPMSIHMRIRRWRRHIYQGVANHVGFDLKTPWEMLSEKARRALLYGLGEEHVTFTWRGRGGATHRHGGPFPGVLAELRERHKKTQSSFMREYYEKYMRTAVCSACRGARLNEQALAVRVDGKNLHDLSAMPVGNALEWFAARKFPPLEQRIAADVIREIIGRLGFLRDVGLDYLSLNRTAPTLSGGESQRIRLAGQIGAGLVGVLYILDEPSIGLHPRDQERLLNSLRRLRDLGNTVIVVEHDEQTMRTADEIVDFGPGPGVRGGEVVAQGDMETVLRSTRSLTATYLRGEQRIEIPPRRPVSRTAPAAPSRKARSGAGRGSRKRDSGK